MRETILYDYVYSRNHCLRRFSAGFKHVRLDMTARDKGAPDKGHTTLFSSSKVVHYFPNFRNYFGMEYEQPWTMGKVLLEWYEFGALYFQTNSDGRSSHQKNMKTWRMALEVWKMILLDCEVPPLLWFPWTSPHQGNTWGLRWYHHEGCKRASWQQEITSRLATHSSKSVYASRHDVSLVHAQMITTRCAPWNAERLDLLTSNL